MVDIKFHMVALDTNMEFLGSLKGRMIRVLLGKHRTPKAFILVF